MDHPTKKNEKVSTGEETKIEFGTGQQQHLTKKEALMNMIAQEMITSLLGGATNDDDGGDGDDDHQNSKKDEKRLEELQRKLMQRQKSSRRASAKAKKRSSMSSRTSSSTPNNQKGDSQGKTRRKSSSRTSTNSTTSSTTPRSSVHKATTHDVVVVDDDDDSFAGGCLDDLVDRPPPQQQHRRTSNEGRSVTAGSTYSASGRSSTAGGGGRSVEETTSRTSSKALSIDEIRQYVLDNIPPAVREQIPEDAWEQIFGSGPHQSNSKATSKSSKQSSAANKSKNSQSSSKNSESPIEEIVIGTDGDGNNDTLDDDDISMFSEVSGLTSAFPDGKTVESRRESMGGQSSVKPSLHTIPQSAQEEDGSKSRGDSTSKGGSVGAHSARSSAQYSRNNSITGGKNDDEEEEKQSESATAENSLYNERLTAIAAAATTTTNNNNNKILTGIKEVRFSDIEVRYYQRIVTDNPAVKSGPAIGIGWRFKRGGIVSIDYWEQGKPMKRKSSELVLPRHVRESILREAGYTQKEVADMVRATLKLKNQRKQTVNNLPAAGLEEAVEKATRRVTRLLSFGRKKDLIRK